LRRDLPGVPNVRQIELIGPGNGETSLPLSAHRMFLAAFAPMARSTVQLRLLLANREAGPWPRLRRRGAVFDYEIGENIVTKPNQTLCVYYDTVGYQHGWSFCFRANASSAQPAISQRPRACTDHERPRLLPASPDTEKSHRSGREADGADQDDHGRSQKARATGVLRVDRCRMNATQVREQGALNDVVAVGVFLLIGAHRRQRALQVPCRIPLSQLRVEIAVREHA
jgi:hypothetical protein